MGGGLGATSLASTINMRFKVYIVIIFSFLLGNEVFAQNHNIENKFYSGVFLEYNTLIVTHNLKLYSDLNYYKDENFVLSFQPGFEFIYSLAGAEKGFYLSLIHISEPTRPY